MTPPPKFDARFQTPFTMIAAGPSASGKSTFVKQLLLSEKRLVSKPFDYIVAFLGSKNPTMMDLQEKIGPKMKCIRGLPKDIDKYIDSSKNGFLIFDDLMSEASSESQITDIFTKRSHHENISVCLILQNLFYQGKERTNFLRNCHYLVLFNNPLDQTITNTIASRMNPSKKKALINLITDALSKYRYIFLDGKQNTIPEARYRSDLFQDYYQRCFVLHQK